MLEEFFRSELVCFPRKIVRQKFEIVQLIFRRQEFQIAPQSQPQRISLRILQQHSQVHQVMTRELGLQDRVFTKASSEGSSGRHGYFAYRLNLATDEHGCTQISVDPCASVCIRGLSDCISRRKGIVPLPGPYFDVRQIYPHHNIAERVLRVHLVRDVANDRSEEHTSELQSL